MNNEINIIEQNSTIVSKNTTIEQIEQVHIQMSNQIHLRIMGLL